MTAPCEPVTKCHALRMATICSGIGAPEVASIGLPFEHVFVAEIEAFPSAVLAHHWPHVPNLGDMTKIDGETWRGKVDVIVGGTPCQAFSVAGKRESLNDERGNLTLKFVELCDAINPTYVVWENVPGVLSTADNAFGCFLGALSGNDGELFPAGKRWSNAGCVIGPRRKLAWRILDAQYFGLAQRRRRVFVVACPRDGADPCEILFEREGVQRHSAPSREKGETASTIPSRSSAGGDLRATLRQKREGQTIATQEVVGALACNTGPNGHDAGNFMSNQGVDGGYIQPVVMAHGQGNAEIVGDGSPSLTCNHEALICFEANMSQQTPSLGDVAQTITRRTHAAVAFAQNQRAEVTLNDTAGSLKVGGGKPGQGYPAVMTPAMQVRRLTPVECEALQGFPRNYTRIHWRNKPVEDCPDGPRYKALGNSMAVPVMRWILSRLEAQHEGE